MIACRKVNNHNNKNYVIVKSIKYPLKAILAFIIEKNLEVKTSISSNNCKIEFGDIIINVDFLPKKKNKYWIIKTNNNRPNINWSLRIGPLFVEKKIKSVPVFQLINYNNLYIKCNTIVRNDKPYQLVYKNIHSLKIIINLRYYLNDQYIELSNEKKVHKIKFISNSGVVFHT